MKIFQQSKNVLGSTAIITLVAANNPSQVFADLWQKITIFENRFSRFISDSELTKFNQQAGAKTAISPEFKELLNASKAMNQATDGWFNPLILPALKKAGYVNSWPNPESTNNDITFELGSVQDFRAVEIGDDWAKIPSGSALDFGGIGKGFLLEKLGDFLEDQKIKNYWLSLGGDILVNGHDAAGKSWEIGIQNALKLGETVGTISNAGKRMAIATSGTTKRKGVANGRSWNHLINPYSGESTTSSILTCSVTAPNAVLADVAAKFIVLTGESKARQFGKHHQLRRVLSQSLASGKLVTKELL